MFLEKATKMKDKKDKFLQVFINAEKEIKPNLAYAKRNKPEKLVTAKVTKKEN
jgi:hypothetical protein